MEDRERSLRRQRGQAKTRPPPQIGKRHVPSLQNGRPSLLYTAKTHDYFQAFMFFLTMRRKSKPYVCKGLHFYFSFLQISRGRVQFSAHQILEKAQFFFSSGQRPWTISKMWLYVYLPSCAVALSQATTSRCHIDTSDSAFSTSPDMFTARFPNGQQPGVTPKLGDAFTRCELTGSQLLDAELS